MKNFQLFKKSDLIDNFEFYWIKKLSVKLKVDEMRKLLFQKKEN